jgi:MFS family permease
VASSLPAPSHYRYLLILIGFTTLAGGSGVTSSFVVFYNALLAEFPWSHAAGASVYAVNMRVLAISAPLAGWLLDRFGPRWVFPSATALCGLALLACSTLHTLAEFILYYGVLSALGQTALLPVAVVIARWFAPEQRGRAIGFTDVGTGFGTVVFVPASAWLIDGLGWRQAFFLLGVFLLIVLVPLNLGHRQVPSASAEGPLSTSLRGTLSTLAFWMVCVAHLCMSITMTMVNVHLVEFLVGTGTLPRLGASTLFSAVSLISLGGRIFFGWLADRLHGEGAFSIAMSCTMTGFILLLVLMRWPVPWPLYAFVLVYGFAQGAGGIAVAAKTVALFQGPRIGTIFMLVNLSASLGSAFGAWFGGYLFDLYGNYSWPFLTAIGSGVLAIGSMWATRLAARQPALS